MRYTFLISHNPRPAETRRIRNKDIPGLAVWYDAVMSPTYGIGSHMYQRMIRCSVTLTGQHLVDQMEHDMVRYVNRASEIMDVDDPPADFREVFVERTINRIRGLMTQIAKNGVAAGIDPFAGFPLPPGLM